MKQKHKSLFVLSFVVVFYLLSVYLVFIHLYAWGLVLTFALLVAVSYYVQHYVTKKADLQHLERYIASNLKKIFPTYEKLAISFSFGLILLLCTIPAFLPMLQK
jgi:Ca2+/Na+ antiporter